MTIPGRLRTFTGTAGEHAIALYRIAIGLLLLSHGAATIFGVFGGAKSSPGKAAEFASWPTWWAGLIQLAGGILIVTGIGTRTASLIASGSMAYAYFVVHQPNSLLPIENGGVPAALYAWALFILIFTGPGAWAAENLLPRAEQDRAAAPNHNIHPISG